jgi:hypothetical protein
MSLRDMTVEQQQKEDKRLEEYHNFCDKDVFDVNQKLLDSIANVRCTAMC